MSLKRSSVLAAGVLATLAACRSAPVAPGAAAPVVRAAAAVVPIAAPTKAEPVQELNPVAQGITVGLTRLPRGPVLLVDSSSRAIYETSADGTVRPFAPLGSYIAEHVQPYMSLTRISGVWPAMMQVELLYGARTETYSESFGIDIATSKVKPLGRRTVLMGAMPWKGDRVLAFSSTDTGGGVGWTQNGKFIVASGAPTAVPRLPKNAMFTGNFAAYESGAVLAHAVIVPPGDSNDDYDSSTVFVFADGFHPVTARMPSPVNAIVRGRVAEETLVECEHAIRRYDPAGWVDVPLPATASAEDNIRSMTVDDDGTAWLVIGRQLHRASFPALAWTAVTLPEGFVPGEVAATTSNDVWVVGEGGGAILHRGPAPAREPVALPDSQDGFVRLVTKGQEPHPYFDGCQIPLLVLGDAADLAQADVLDAEMPVEIDGGFSRSKLGGRSVYTYETTMTDAPTRAALKKQVPRLKKKFPQAHLVCARPSDAEPVTR